jgi:hypothetical protein
MCTFKVSEYHMVLQEIQSVTGGVLTICRWTYNSNEGGTIL